MSDRLPQLLAFLAKDQNDPFIYYGLALEYRSMGNFAESEAYFRTLLTDFKDYVPAYMMFGQLLIEQNRKAEAKQILLTGIEMGRTAKETHAVSEMNALLDELDDEA